MSPQIKETLNKLLQMLQDSYDDLEFELENTQVAMDEIEEIMLKLRKAFDL